MPDHEETPPVGQPRASAAFLVLAPSPVALIGRARLLGTEHTGAVSAMW